MVGLDALAIETQLTQSQFTDVEADHVPGLAYGEWNRSGWISPEGDFWTFEALAGIRAALDEKRAAEASMVALGATTRLSPKPGHVDPSKTKDGKGSFIVVGDWGNPFNPGTHDAGGAYWGPHWKCTTKASWGPRCQQGSASWNRDEWSQFKVRDEMVKYAQKHEAQFVVNVGDNQYPSGYADEHTYEWQRTFEDRYPHRELQIPWLSILGNHDWGGFECYIDGNGQMTRGYAQIRYDTEPHWQWPQHKQRRWVLPEKYYKKRISFGSTTMDIFGLDTNFARTEEPCGQLPFSTRKCNQHQQGQCNAYFSKIVHDQFHWLAEELRKSDATWKFVFAHHPIEFLGRYFVQPMDLVDLFVRNNVSLYMCGHRHSIEDTWYTSGADERSPPHAGLMRPNSVYQILSGAGGGAFSDQVVPVGGSAHGAPYGFAGVRVTPQKLYVDWIADEGEHLSTVEVVHACSHFADKRCEWIASGGWSNCEVNGTYPGQRHELVECQTGDDDNCANTPKPLKTKPCGWAFDEWGGCENKMRSRTVQCIDEHGCDEIPKPPENEMARKCGWEFPEWGNCTGGIRSRPPECIEGQDWCKNIPKPPEGEWRRKCGWAVRDSDWGKCIDGIRSGTPECIEGPSQEWCNNIPKPTKNESSRKCGWQFPEWGKCTDGMRSRPPDCIEGGDWCKDIPKPPKNDWNRECGWKYSEWSECTDGMHSRTAECIEGPHGCDDVPKALKMESCSRFTPALTIICSIAAVLAVAAGVGGVLYCRRKPAGEVRAEARSQESFELRERQ